MKTSLPEFKRGDAVRLVIRRKPVLACVVATIEPAEPEGERAERVPAKNRFRLLTEDGETVERNAAGIKAGEAGDREKLTTALAKLEK